MNVDTHEPTFYRIVLSINYRTKQMKCNEATLLGVLGGIAFLTLVFLVASVICTPSRSPMDDSKHLLALNKNWMWIETPLKMEFLVVVVCTPNYDANGAKGVNSLALYCKQHGYGFGIRRTPIQGGLHVNFTKNIAAIEAMQQFGPERAQFVVNIDADVGVKTPTKSLRSLIQNKSKKGVMYAPEDRFSEPNKINSSINAGFIIWRNSARAQTINDKWLHVARTSCSQQAKKHPRQQNVFQHCIQPKLKPGELVLIDHRLVGMEYSSFINQKLRQHESWRKLGSPTTPLHIQ
mgnify:CR=1 FL=1